MLNRLTSIPSSQSFALKSGSFRRFTYGSLLTRSADWMELTILNWVVYERTNSAFMLGLLNACRLIPVFMFSLPAGVLADRFSRQKILIINYFTLFLAGLTTAFVVDNEYSVTALLIVVALKSIFTTVETSVRNAFLSDLVEKSMLPSAISIQTTIINLARMTGPALAGLLLVYFPAGWMMYFVSAGSLIVLISLLFVEPLEKGQDWKPKAGKKPMKSAWNYIKNEPKVQSILLIAIAPMVFGFPYTTMLPLFSKELFDLGPNGFGLLLSISSLGAIGASVMLSNGSPNNPGRILILSSLSFGVLLTLFMLFKQSLIMIHLLMFMIGFASQYYRTLSRVILQLNVEEQFRGRVLSIALMDRGFIPLGALLTGAVGSLFGAMTAGLFMGIGCIFSTLVIAKARKDFWKEN